MADTPPEPLFHVVVATAGMTEPVAVLLSLPGKDAQDAEKRIRDLASAGDTHWVGHWRVDMTSDALRYDAIVRVAVVPA